MKTSGLSAKRVLTDERVAELRKYFDEQEAPCGCIFLGSERYVCCAKHADTVDDAAQREKVAIVGEIPQGFRDLYWCWIINEPEIALGNGMCPGCDYSVIEVKDRHTFIAHIKKPRG